MAIRVICKNCQSKIDAKDELLGQARKCPKCQNPILIQQETANSSAQISKNTAVPTKVVVPGSPENNEKEYDNLNTLPREKIPTHINPNDRYFILAYDRIVAYWEAKNGWQYNVGTGFASAKRNKDVIPNEGNYVFVEMIIKQIESGKQLAGLRLYAITAKWALPLIARESYEILSKLEGKAMLSKQQRLYLLTFLRKNYMPDFLKNAPEVYSFLTCDYTTETEVFVANDQ